MAPVKPGSLPPQSSHIGVLDLLAPGAVIVLSSVMLALSTLFVRGENIAIFRGSLARPMMAALLHEQNLHDLVAQSWFQATFVVFFLSLGSVAVLWAWRRIPERRALPAINRWVVVVAALALAPQVLSWPLWSTDVLLYNLHARISSVHGENPFVVAARDLPGRCMTKESRFEAAPECISHADCAAGSVCRADPYLELSPWSKHPASYGPAAVALANSTYDAELGIYGNAVAFGLRIALYFLMAGLLLGWAVSTRAMMLLLWSPLGWLESGNGGHYEGPMILALVGLFAIWQSRDRRFAPEAMGVVGGALLLFKITAGLLMLPLFLAWRRAGGFGRALRFAGVVSLAVVIGYALVWDAPHPFGGLFAESTKTVRSPLHLIRHFFRWSAGGDPMGWLSPVALVGLLIWTGRGLMKDEAVAEPFALMGTLWLFATCFAFGAFHPWHVLVLLMLGLLSLPGSSVYRAVIVLAQIAPIVGYGSFLFLRRFDLVAMVPSVLLIFVPVLWLWFHDTRLSLPDEPHAGAGT